MRRCSARALWPQRAWRVCLPARLLTRSGPQLLGTGSVAVSSVFSLAKTYPRLLVVVNDQLLCARSALRFCTSADQFSAPRCCKLDEMEVCTYKWLKKARRAGRAARRGTPPP